MTSNFLSSFAAAVRVAGSSAAVAQTTITQNSNNSGAVSGSNGASATVSALGAGSQVSLTSLSF